MTTQSSKITRADKENLTERASDRPRMAPPVDVYENKDEILVIADLPGVDSEGLAIRLEDAELVIRGSQPEPTEKEPWQPIEFYRSFRIPNTVDPGGIAAELKQGVLRLTLRKREEAKPRQVAVKVT